MGILACSTTMKHRNHHHVPSSHNNAKNTDYLCQKGVWHDHCWCCRSRIFPPKYRHSWSNNPLDLVVEVDQLAGSTQTIRFVNIASTKRPSETQLSEATGNRMKLEFETRKEEKNHTKLFSRRAIIPNCHTLDDKSCNSVEGNSPKQTLAWANSA
jgi:hypothetical protein